MSRKKSSVVLESKIEEEEDDQAPFYEEVKSDLKRAGLLEEVLSPEEVEKLPVHEQWGIDCNGKKIVPHSEIPSNECEIPTCDIHEKELEEKPKMKPKMKHKNCYCVMDGPDDIVIAFLPEALDNKARGKLFQIIGELGFSMEKTTTLSASELFDRQQVEEPVEPQPEKTLFDGLKEE